MEAVATDPCYMVTRLALVIWLKMVRTSRGGIICDLAPQNERKVAFITIEIQCVLGSRK